MYCVVYIKYDDFDHPYTYSKFVKKCELRDLCLRAIRQEIEGLGIDDEDVDKNFLNYMKILEKNYYHNPLRKSDLLKI